MTRATTRRRVIAVAALVLAGGPACAGDWSIQALIDTEVNVAENRALREKSLGVSFAHISRTNVDFDYAMADGNFNISTDLTSNLFFGEARADGKDDYLPHLGMSWLKTGKTDSIKLSADYRIQNVTLQDILETPLPLAEPLFVPVDTVNQTLSAGLIWTHKIDTRDTLTFDNLISTSKYNNPVGTDNTLITSSLAWERQLSKRSTGTITAGVNWLNQADVADTNRYVHSLDGKLVTKLSKRLTATVGVGLNYTNTDNIGPDPKATLSGDLSMALDYNLKTTKIGFSADYGLQQGALGDFQNQLNTSLTVTETINDRSSISATARVLMAEDEFGGGLGSDFSFFFTPTYSIALTDEWNLKAGYRFVYRDAVTSTSSNTVFVSMARNFTVMP
jgi:hypothetical protein